MGEALRRIRPTQLVEPVGLDSRRDRVVEREQAQGQQVKEVNRRNQVPGQVVAADRLRAALQGARAARRLTRLHNRGLGAEEEVDEREVPRLRQETAEQAERVLAGLPRS